MHHLFGGGSQRGSTILAALLLVVTVGVFSTVLHYGKTLNDRLVYQPQALTATGLATPPPPLMLTDPAATPSNPPATPTSPSDKPATQSKDVTGNVCGQNELKGGQVSGGSSGANQGAVKFTGQCLPGCTYKVSVGGTEGSMEGTYKAVNAKDKIDPSKPCTVCFSGKGGPGGCVTQKVDAEGNPIAGGTMLCDEKGENCKKMDESGGETSAATRSLTRGITPLTTPPAEASEIAKQFANEAAKGTDAGNAAAKELAANYATTPEKAAGLQTALQQEANKAGWGSGQAVMQDQITKLGALAQGAGGGGGGGSSAPDSGPGFTMPLDWYTKQLGVGGGGTPAPVPIPAPAPGDVPGRTGMPDTSFNPGGIGGGITSGIASFLGGVMRGMGYGGMGGYGGYGGYGGMGGYGSGGYGVPPGNTIPQAPGSCNTQYMCQGQTLFYRNNQCVDQPMQQCQYGCNGNQCAQQNGQQQQGQYGYGTNGQPCMQPPVQPNAATCTTGTWKPTSGTNNGCTTGWQCVADGSTNTAPPIASLSCQSQVADVGSVFAISYSCQRAADSIGGGFDTRGQLVGATTTIINDPPAGTNTATYTLGCRSVTGLVVGAQCSVQINKPLIALTTQPPSIPSGATSTVGWVTSGMQSCIVSSPDNATFTLQNAGSTNVNGVAVTPPLTSTTRIQLTCTTFGGGTRATSTTIGVFSE